MYRQNMISITKNAPISHILLMAAGILINCYFILAPNMSALIINLPLQLNELFRVVEFLFAFFIFKCVQIITLQSANFARNFLVIFLNEIFNKKLEIQQGDKFRVFAPDDFYLFDIQIIAHFIIFDIMYHQKVVVTSQ